MIEKITRWLIIVFLLLTVALLAWFKLTQPRILVLQSYDPGYVWARDTDAGIERVFKNDLRYKLQWHYMDVKRHPDAEFKRRAGQLATREIENFKPDIIIAMDDDAQQYAASQYAGNPKVNIVFGGINDSVEPYGYNRADNATGIYERKPLHALLNAIRDMRRRDGSPLGARIVHLGDQSPSVIADSKEIETMDWSPFKLAVSRRVATFAEWQAAVSAAVQQGDLLLVSNYQNIAKAAGSPEIMNPVDVMRWTEEHSAIPVVGIGGYLVEDGGMFAVGASGFEQGETMARMALEILSRHTRPKDIPQVMPRQYLIYMRQAVLEKRGLALPGVYEAFSRASNNYR